MRCFINTDFLFVCIGQTILATAQPLIYNQPVKLSAMWFPKHERIISTMVTVNAAIVGCVVGFFIPSLYVTAEISEDSLNITYHRDEIKV